MPARLVVLASGTGTTLQAVLDDAELGRMVVAAGTDRPDCAAMRRAGARGIPTFSVEPAAFADRDAWNDALAAVIAGYAPDLVVLAGFMRVLAARLVERFRVVNTHPSLLPAFPGAHAVRDALAAGVPATGVTVHWVDEGVDTGPVIAQAEVPVLAGDDEATLRARVQSVEKPLYLQAIRQLCSEFEGSA